MLIFLDDVLTFSKTPVEHLEHLEIVFRVVRKPRFRPKPKKCILFRTEVHYLGHVLNKERIQPDPKQLAAMGASDRRRGISFIWCRLQLLPETFKTSQKCLVYFIC